MCPVYSACVQYAKPWPHSDIKPCCRQSAHDHVFTSRYDSILLGHAFFYTEGVFAWDIAIHITTELVKTITETR